ncbi:MAG: transporter [Eubacterium sp.]|nr:transporter [Eubacterium sp.]
MEKEKHLSSLWTKDFLSITIVNLLIFCGFQMLLPTLPVYIKSLGGTNSIIGWIAGVSTIASLLIRPFSGMALDRLGRKVVFITGLLIIIAVTLAYGWFPMVGFIIAIRFLHGFGWGAASTASNTIASDIIPKGRFAEGMGFFSLSTSLAMALAPGIGIYILSSFSFGHLSILSAGMGVVALLFSFLIRYNKPEKLKSVEVNISPYEKASIPPSVVMFLVSASYGSITGFISLYALDRGIKNIGIFFTIYAISLLISRPLFGKLIDRFGFKTAIYPGFIILVLAMLMLSGAYTLAYFLISGFLYGVGFSAVQSSLQTMSVISAPKERLGAANATFFTGFDGGIGFGSVIAGIIASSLGYSRMYLLFTAFIVLAGILYFIFVRNKLVSDK